MSEHKGDDLLATGTHRAWTGEPVGSVLRGNTPHDNWIERPKASSRHGAITRSLYSWSSYKNWTEKVRSNWDKDKK
jgi:hypothetical protein